MSADPSFEPPAITDEDIRWASRLLRLGEDGFHGKDGSDPRQKVLKTSGTIEVAACPGSGKTTLLVAKLAILAKKWPHRTRGICVLSHTNAARREIEKLVGNEAAGQRLLAYPHFIGTIHAFVDHFLTLPLLRSFGYKSTQFSTEIAGQQLWALSGYGAQLPPYLYRKIPDKDRRKAAVCHAHYVGEKRDLRLEAENATVWLLRKKDTDSFRLIDKWKSTVLQAGYAAYEDTFAYGHRALKENRYLVSTLRDRFPLLFIDEAQDNSEQQSAILHRIFMDGTGSVRRQRFGDPNQAIFSFVGAKGATKHKFPDGKIEELPNSHRFGEHIAQLAGPLGVTQYDGGLIGQGPSTHRLARQHEGRHTIFLFDDDGAGKVLDAYGVLLLETFSEPELIRGSFVVVGQVHKLKGDDRKPRHVGHYWSDYDPELSKAEPKPQTLVQYVFAGLGKAEAIGEAYPAVEKIAEGILRLAGMAEGGTTLPPRRHRHRYVLQRLEKSPDIQVCYKTLISRLALRRKGLRQETWDNRCCGLLRQIAETLADAPLSGAEADPFLKWKDEPDALPPPSTTRKRRDNIYRYSNDKGEVAIRVGSIHSVKGETHTATLVLETFWHKHNLADVLHWLDGSESGAESPENRQADRLKLHYVAMTRPTHLLCLAMKRSPLEDADGRLDHSKIDELKRHGWNVEPI
jgi:superfamily I DNA/RNA helicase